MVVILLAVFVSLVGVIVGIGFWVSRQKKSINTKNAANILKAVAGVGTMLIIMISLSVLVVAVNKGHAAETKPVADHQQVVTTTPKDGTATGLGYLAIAIAVGIGSLGAGIATGMSAAAAIGAISEDPKVFGSAIIFVGLSEGIAIYGLVIAIMLLSKV